MTGLAERGARRLLVRATAANVPSKTRRLLPEAAPKGVQRHNLNRERPAFAR